MCADAKLFFTLYMIVNNKFSRPTLCTFSMIMKFKSLHVSHAKKLCITAYHT